MTPAAVPEFVVVALSARVLAANRPQMPALALTGAPLRTVLADADDVLEAWRLAGRYARELCGRHILRDAA